MIQKLTFPLCILLVVHIWSSHSQRIPPKLLDYGEPCSLQPTDSDPKCNGQKNLECSSSTSPNVCACKVSPEYNQIEYDKEVKACFPVAGVLDAFRCQTDFQCRSSSYGSFSRCNSDIGTCECYHQFEETKLVDNICFLAKPIPYGFKTVSMPPCTQDDDCSSSALGQLSRCNRATQFCECFDTITNGRRPIGPYNGNCVPAKKLEEFCESDDECRVGALVNAVCSTHENYLSSKEKVCVCPPGVQCDDYSSANSRMKISFLSLCILTIGIFFSN